MCALGDGCGQVQGQEMIKSKKSYFLFIFTQSLLFDVAALGLLGSR